jgi:hypothetical protein
MFHHLHHPSDETLLLAVDGELSTRRRGRLDRHLAVCDACRGRRHELERSIEEFSSAWDERPEQRLETEALRARLQLRVTDLSRALNRSWRVRLADLFTLPQVAMAAATVALVVVAAVVLGPRFTAMQGSPDDLVIVEPGALPVRSLTPPNRPRRSIVRWQSSRAAADSGSDPPGGIARLWDGNRAGARIRARLPHHS